VNGLRRDALEDGHVVVGGIARVPDENATGVAVDVAAADAVDVAVVAAAGVVAETVVEMVRGGLVDV
jgi:phosphoglucomutase